MASPPIRHDGLVVVLATAIALSLPAAVASLPRGDRQVERVYGVPESQAVAASGAATANPSQERTR